jgi:uncharacterized membrane protein
MKGFQGILARIQLPAPASHRSVSERLRGGWAGSRVALTSSIGVVAGFVASAFIPWQASILIGWDVTVVCLALWIWLAVWTMNAAEAKSHASREDPSIRLSELIVLTSGVALLAAVGLVLIRAGNATGATKAYLIALGVLSVALSWGLVQTVFTLRYARTYFRAPVGGVDFNEDDPPTYLDFAYLALTVGMTFQVSDTNLTSKRRFAGSPWSMPCSRICLVP